MNELEDQLRQQIIAGVLAETEQREHLAAVSAAFHAERRRVAAVLAPGRRHLAIDHRGRPAVCYCPVGRTHRLGTSR